LIPDSLLASNLPPNDFGSMPSIFWLAPIASIAALICARLFFSRMAASPDGTPRMVEIGGHIRDGAMAYLRQ
jgi:K(+)-stimulated pyrophosphate-energized sodium pump